MRWKLGKATFWDEEINAWHLVNAEGTVLAEIREPVISGPIYLLHYHCRQEGCSDNMGAGNLAYLRIRGRKHQQTEHGEK